MNSILLCELLNKGTVEVDVDHPFECHIGLVSISLPSIKLLNRKITEIYVSCDQVDSTRNNRKRLIQVLGYGKNQARQWTTYDFSTILYYNIDSSERKLTFRIYDRNGPIEPSTDENNSNKIIMKLNMIPTKTLQKL